MLPLPPALHTLPRPHSDDRWHYPQRALRNARCTISAAAFAECFPAVLCARSFRVSGRRSRTDCASSRGPPLLDQLGNGQPRLAFAIQRMLATRCRHWSVSRRESLSAGTTRATGLLWRVMVAPRPLPAREISSQNCSLARATIFVIALSSYQRGILARAPGMGQQRRGLPGFGQPHPGGMIENSPALQRWVCASVGFSPEGTAEAVVFSRPFGTNVACRAYPTLKRWAIVICPSGTGSSQPHRADRATCSATRGCRLSS